MTSDFAPAVAK